MTAKNSLYQLIISRLDGSKIRLHSYQEEIFRLIQKGIGGFIIFGGEIDEVRSFITEMQARAKLPLFIASDIERGVGQQINGAGIFPCQMAVGAAVKRGKTEDISLLQNAVSAISREAIDVGINMPLIPVLDVNTNPYNPIICTRAFSDSPEDAAWFGSEYIKIMEGYGLISCAKHFPGHGDASIDSHISLPCISISYKDLMEIDVMPFAKAVKSGVSSIMVGHLHIPVIDSMPASLSRRIVTELLRDKLGFNGLILTDALNMSAVSNIKNVSTASVKAGVDILLHPADADAVVLEIEGGLRVKEIDEKCIESSLERILKAKARLRDIKKTGVDYSRNRELSLSLTDMSITIAKDDAGLLPIRSGSVVLAGDKQFHNISLWKKSFSDVSVIGNTKLGHKRERVIIIPVFSQVSAWKGSSGIDDDEKQRIIEIIRNIKRSIVISFGSPYILSGFKDADMLIAAYDTSGASQMAVIKCLKGEMLCRGGMPVKLNLN